jgi:hypothetical protein
MPHHHIEQIEISRLATVQGGGAWDRAKDAWQGTKNFAGGLGAGLTYGPMASERAVNRYADSSSQATKAGFEVGAMGNMAMGPVGGLIATVAGGVPTGDGGGAR